MNKTTPAQIISTTLPAGKYIVGDPCYSMGDHENWISWLERADYRNQKTILEAKTPNGIAAGVSTMQGIEPDAEKHSAQLMNMVCGDQLRHL